MHTPTRTRILALDPGLRDLGYAVLHGALFIDAGVQTFRAVPLARRREHALRALRDWIERYRPQVLVLEAVHKNSLPSFRALWLFFRAVQREARRCGLPVAIYPAQAARKSLLGNGWATKHDAATALAARFPTLRVYLRQKRQWQQTYFHNLFDALALAVHHQAQDR